MKRILIITGLLFATIISVNAQQLPLYNEYMLNGFLMNPAMAGKFDYIPVILTVRNQWIGVKDGAPATQSLSAHGQPFKNKALGVGGYLFNDMMGPVSRIGLSAAFAYHLPLNSEGMKLSMGLSLTGFQNKVDFGQIKFASADNADTKAVESSFVPDANFGVYFYNTKYFAGFSIAQLFQWKIKVGSSSSDGNPMVRHYYLNGGYRFAVGNEFEIEPSALLKTTENRNPVQFDLNAKAIYKKAYWAGLSYRTNDAMVILIGMKVKKLFFGYSFDYAFSSLSRGTYGSHELMIGFNIGENFRGASLL